MLTSSSDLSIKAAAGLFTGLLSGLVICLVFIISVSAPAECTGQYALHSLCAARTNTKTLLGIFNV